MTTRHSSYIGCAREDRTSFRRLMSWWYARLLKPREYLHAVRLRLFLNRSTKQYRKSKRVLRLMLVLYICFVASYAYACRCLWSSTESMYEEVDAVFLGTVTDVSIVNERTITREDGVSVITGDRKEAVIDISESWKGAVAGTVVVATEVHPGMCGISFEEHATFLVFAYVAQPKEKSSEGETNGNENQPITFTTNRCTNTTKWTNSEDDLKVAAKLRRLQANDHMTGEGKIVPPSIP